MKIFSFSMYEAVWPYGFIPTLSSNPEIQSDDFFFIEFHWWARWRNIYSNQMSSKFNGE